MNQKGQRDYYLRGDDGRMVDRRKSESDYSFCEMECEVIFGGWRWEWQWHVRTRLPKATWTIKPISAIVHLLAAMATSPTTKYALTKVILKFKNFHSELLISSEANLYEIFLNFRVSFNPGLKCWKRGSQFYGNMDKMWMDISEKMFKIKNSKICLK